MHEYASHCFMSCGQVFCSTYYAWVFRNISFVGKHRCKAFSHVFSLILFKAAVCFTSILPRKATTFASKCLPDKSSKSVPCDCKELWEVLKNLKGDAWVDPQSQVRGSRHSLHSVVFGLCIYINVSTCIYVFEITEGSIRTINPEMRCPIYYLLFESSSKKQAKAGQYAKNLPQHSTTCSRTKWLRQTEQLSHTETSKCWSDFCHLSLTVFWPFVLQDGFVQVLSNRWAQMTFTFHQQQGISAGEVQLGFLDSWISLQMVRRVWRASW